MPDAFATTRLILDAMRADQTPEKWLASFSRFDIDWDDLVVRSIVFGLAPQLHQQFTVWDIPLPPRAKAKLAVTYQAQARRNEAIYHQLEEILVACAAHNLQPIALKGVHLATHWYASPALRPMNDIDLLFTPAEMPTVKRVLTGLGYQGKYKSADLGPGITKHTSTYRRLTKPADTPNPYLSVFADRLVEPHTSLEESWFGLKVDITPGLSERAITVALGKQQCRVLANEDLLLHLCVHLCFHLIMGAPLMVQLSDLLIVIRSNSVDWSEFILRTIARRAAPYTLAALSLSQKLLAAPVPESVLSQLMQYTPRPIRRHIMRLDLDTVLRRTQQKPLTSIPQRLLRGLQDRAETARWAPDWRGRWQVWRTALQVGRTDTGRMLLGKTSTATNKH